MAFLAPIIPYIIAGAAAVTTGLEVKSAFSKPDMPQPTNVDATGQLRQQAQDQERQKQAAIARLFPDLQQQLGGAVAPEYYQQIAGNEVGAPGGTGSAQTAWGMFQGGDGTHTPGATSPTPGGANSWEQIRDNFMPGSGSEISGGYA